MLALRIVQKSSGHLGEIHTPANSKCCIICESVDHFNLHKVVNNVVDANLESWAKTNKYFLLLGRMVATSSDTHAADTR